MKKQYRAILSVLLAIFLCCQLPVAAGETSKIDAESVDLSAYQEITENRSANSKHFRMPDGTCVAVAYDASVHYEKDGEWVDIDNTLVDATLIGTPQMGEIKRNDELTDQDRQAIEQNAQRRNTHNAEYYENNANDFQVQLPKDIDSDTPIVITYEGHTVRFSANNIKEVSSNIEQPLSEAEATQKLQKALVGVTDTESQERIKKEHATSLQRNRSAVKYPSAQNGIDINYYVSGQSLKEDIVLRHVPTARSFSFDFTYTGLQAVLQPDSSVLFIDEAGETIFVIPAPYMFDSDMGYSTDIAVTVEQTEDGCRYTLTPSRAWLEDEQRVYPVTVDPWIETTQNASYIHDNGVQQINPITPYTENERMYVGYTSDGTKEARVYFKLTQWPSATGMNAATISEAYLYFSYYPQASWQTANGITINVHKVPSSWDTNTLTWNTQPSMGSMISSLTLGDRRGKTSGYDEYNVTQWVKSHYSNPSTDYGICFDPSKGNDLEIAGTNWACYISSDYYTNTARRPIIEIYYTAGGGTASGINSGQVYYLRNANSGKYLDVPSSASADGTDLIQFSFHGGTNQQFKVVYNPSTLDYTLSPVCAPNSAVEITNTSPYNDAVVQIWSKPSSGASISQRFNIVKDSSGRYQLFSCASNYQKRIVVYNAGTDDCAAIIQHENNGTANGYWYLEPVASQTISRSVEETLLWLPSLGNSVVPYSHRITLSCSVTIPNDATATSRIVREAYSLAYYYRSAQQEHPVISIRNITIDNNTLNLVESDNEAILGSDVVFADQESASPVFVGETASFSSYVLCVIQNSVVPANGFSCDFTF